MEKKKNKPIYLVPLCVRPILRITPYAWGKIRYMNSLSRCELAGFGVSDKDDLLLIRDFVVIKQTVTGGNCKFNDIAVAEYFEEQVDAGFKPQHFARIWIHSHPDTYGCAPSGTDEDTFERVFGKCDWAIMLIVNKNGDYYVRLALQKGLKVNFLLPLKVDKAVDRFGKKIDKQKCKRQYDELVEEQEMQYSSTDFNLSPTPSILPAHLFFPVDIIEKDFIDFCNTHGHFKFDNWTQAHIDYWVIKYREALQEIKGLI